MSNYSSPAPTSLQQNKQTNQPTNQPTNQKEKKNRKNRDPKEKNLENPEKSLRKNRNAHLNCFRFGTSFHQQQCHHFLQAFGTCPCE
jgi:hypothetical protein